MSRDPGRGRRYWMLPAAGLAVAVVVVLVALPDRGSGRGAGAAGASPAATAPRAAAAAPDVTWAPVAGVDLPVSRLHGPRRTAGGAAAGYSRSAPGAAIAAVQVLVRTSPGAGPGVFDPVLAEQVTGPDLPSMLLVTRDEYERLRAQAGSAPGAPAQQATARVAGYVVRALDLEAGDATVDVVLSSPDLDAEGRSVAFRVDLRWTQDDWRVVAPPGGDWGAVATPLGGLPAGLLTYGG